MADSKSYPSNSSSPSGKHVKAPNVFERAKEEFEAVVHNGKHRHEHHKETHGLRDDIDSNTPISDVKAPNVFERAKEEFEAIVEAIHPKKESKSHDSHGYGETRNPAAKSHVKSETELHSDHQESQYYQISQYSPNSNQIPISEQLQPSQNISHNWFCDVQQTETNRKGNAWCEKEDVSLMLSWCSVSEDKVHVKNQKGASVWA
ncbi:uncharacterized protein LOC130986810 isoform X1 [Salvia miltiorrhiza]|uniref:uncharacterized protein LOC130986810 isoform X1 n=1 Tax=Salvia miltiorrhiza TaxID=226208 RepID=UPI0025AC3B7F|nr:uncharacterized protein LOC130986810 isoform X1 [Salvia miltiorrhiza]